MSDIKQLIMLLTEVTARDAKTGIASWEQIKDAKPFTELPNYNPNKNNEKRYAFKQFKTLYNPNDPSTEKYKGMLFPLFIKNEGDVSKSGIKLGKWYRCGQGALQGAFDKDHKPVKYTSGDLKGQQKVAVNSKLGNLSYRPGWHIGSSPLTRHIGAGDKTKDNDYDLMHAQNVWAVLEFAGRPLTDADTAGKKTSNGIKDFRDDDSFKGSYYHFKTNSSADKDEDWIIADAIKVVCVLNDEEVKQIVGSKAQKRNKNLSGGEADNFSADFNQFKDHDKNKDIELFKSAKEKQEQENRREQGEISSRKLNHDERAKGLEKWAYSSEQEKITKNFLKSYGVSDVKQLTKEQKAELKKKLTKKSIGKITVESLNESYFNY